MSAVDINLTQDDMKRINNVDYYVMGKKIVKSRMEYKDFEVGTAVLIKHKKSGSYLSNGSWYRTECKPPSKYLIIHNDDGFVFVKRIISSGAPGKTVECLTIQYPCDEYEIVCDEDYADAVLLDEEYDPTASAKDEKRKKGKASRYNDKFRVRFKEPMDAYAYLKALKVGDKIWSAGTTFGDMPEEWQVQAVDFIKVDASQVSRDKQSWGYRNRRYLQPHSAHDEAGFGIVVGVKVRQLQGSYGYNREDTIYFYNICSGEYNKTCEIWYTKKPLGPKDMT